MSMFGFGPFSCPPPSLKEQKEQVERDTQFADFIMDLMGTIGSDKVKSQVSVVQAYRKTSDTLHKIVEYGFLRDDIPESERATVRDLLSQINTSAEEFCKNHNITETEKEN